MRHGESVGSACQQEAQESAIRQASGQSQGWQQPRAIICKGWEARTMQQMGTGPSIQLGTCPTVDSETEDEAVKGWIGPGLLGQDQAKVASGEGGSRGMGGYAKSFQGPQKSSGFGANLSVPLWGCGIWAPVTGLRFKSE